MLVRWLVKKVTQIRYVLSNLKEYIMDNETVDTTSMDSETIAILLDDRVATGG